MFCRRLLNSARPCVKEFMWPLEVYIVNHVLRPLGRLPHHSLHKHCLRNYSNSFNRSVFSNKNILLDIRQSGCLCHMTRGLRMKVEESALKKKVTALSSKRPKKKKLQTGKEGIQKVIAYPLTDDEVDLESLGRSIDKIGLYKLSPIMEDMKDVIHLTSQYAEVEEEFFVFREGSLVCWNVPDVERDEMVGFLRRHIEDPYQPSLIMDESDGMEFSYTDTSSNIVGDQLKIKKTNHQLNADKYAFSNALSQSVKLAVWESSLENFIDSIKNITEKLKMGSKISISRQEVLRRHGEIFELRYLMNLNSELLDTPDFYWEREENLESLYKKLYNHLDIGRRTKVMNEKLNYCCQIIEVIDHKVSDAQHVRLEWFIIILILIEVVFEIIHIYERHYLLDVNQPQISNCDDTVQ